MRAAVVDRVYYNVTCYIGFCTLRQGGGGIEIEYPVLIFSISAFGEHPPTSFS